MSCFAKAWMCSGVWRWAKGSLARMWGVEEDVVVVEEEAEE